ARRQRCHLDLLPLRKDGTKGLVLDKTIAQVDHGVPIVRGDAPDTEVGTTKFPHPAGVNPLMLRKRLVLRDQDGRVMPGDRGGRVEDPFGRLVPRSPAEALRSANGDRTTVAPPRPQTD